MRVPPSRQNSAVTSSWPSPFRYSMNACGNVFSRPTSKPIFIACSLFTGMTSEVLDEHLLPPRPIVPGRAPDVERVGNALGGKDTGQPLRRVIADVARSSHHKNHVHVRR